MTPLEIITQKLAEIEAREKAATEGPWEAKFNGSLLTDIRSKSSRIKSHERGIALIAEGGREESGPDSAFIAHARTDIPKLRKALNKAISSMKSACYCWDDIDKCEHCEDLKEIADILESK